MTTIRVRIAPSPSGFLHIGTAKIALMNWLYARKNRGTFILRLEDTDAERTEEQYVEAMCAGFHWLGIDWDEGPPFGDVLEKGPYAPYRQSQRVQIHRDAALRLVAEGKAYRCFCSKEELEVERERATAEKRPPRYSGKCAHLSADDIAARSGQTSVIRFRVPAGSTTIHDLVQGDVRVENKEFDDFVIAKPNGDPIFHLAVVVDDGEMKITHVIRGDDHLTNAARHVMLFEALGYPVPQFAHLPMVLDEQGKKYSKRLHGANVLDWRDDGYLPETLLNYVALLGWTPGDDRDVFTREELIEAFSLERCSQSAAKFDLKRVQWLNGQHIRMLTAEDLRDRVLPILHRAGFDTASKSAEWLTQMAAICQEKIKTLNEIVEYTDFFFAEPATYEEKAVKKQWTQPDAVARMDVLRGLFADAPEWNAEALKAAFETTAATTGQSLGNLVHPTRLALTGKSVGPGLFELAIQLGREACMVRIDKGIAHIRSLVPA